MKMNRLSNKLIAVFLAATLIPLVATLWLTTSLLEHSLSYANTSQLDRLSRMLERTGRELYQQYQEALRADVSSGRLRPAIHPVTASSSWPDPVKDFWESGSAERFYLSGERGERLNWLVRRKDGVLEYTKTFRIGLTAVSDQYRQARRLVASAGARDLRRGFTYTFILLATSVWLVSLAALVWCAARISRPIQRLTEGLSELAAGNLSVRVADHRDDEIGAAIRAFNHMAEQLQESRSRLVYLTQLASWQTLARKMAHEVKNSLTPIRLNVEEMVARHGENDREFVEQAAQIIVDEVNSLERRVRAFSEFAAEPPVEPKPLDLNAMIEERIALLKHAHAGVTYDLRLSPDRPRVMADEDLLRGILTNLLENAAQAAGPGGTVLVRTGFDSACTVIDIQDSGPGLSPLARQSLFEPTISFKRGGMGLGLSIARKSALLSGGDIVLIEGELSGAAFRVKLPRAAAVAAQVSA